MRYYLLVETAENSGLFGLSSVSVDAPCSSQALLQLASSVTGNLRIGVWPYDAMSGDPALRPPQAAEAGKSYLVLAQAGGASQPFTITDETVSSDTVDAALPLIARQADLNYRLGLMLKPAEATAGTGTAAGGSTSGSITPASTTGSQPAPAATEAETAHT
jgi:hypothetical protein